MTSYAAASLAGLTLQLGKGLCFSKGGSGKGSDAPRWWLRAALAGEGKVGVIGTGGKEGDLLMES